MAVPDAQNDNIRIAELADDAARHLVSYRSEREMADAFEDAKVELNTSDYSRMYPLHISKVGDRYRVASEVPADRAYRAMRVCRYLQDIVLPYLREFDLSGVYPVSFEDECDLPGVLTFSRPKDARSVLMPDFYQMTDYEAFFAKLGDHVEPPFESKTPKMVFAGVSTGDMDPSRNERVAACKWSAEGNRDISEFYITQTVQMASADLKSYLGPELLRDVMHDFVGVPAQLSYKYIVSIDGNTCAWDRPVWIMRSKSVLFKLRSGYLTNTPEKVGWYYPLMQADEHYTDVGSLDYLRQTFAFVNNNPRIAEYISKTANQFANRFCFSRNAHVGYMARLFVTHSEHGRR